MSQRMFHLDKGPSDANRCRGLVSRVGIWFFLKEDRNSLSFHPGSLCYKITVDK